MEVDQSVQAVAVRHLGGDHRISFELADATAWLSGYDGEPFDMAFVDCIPGKFEHLDKVLKLLHVGGLRPGVTVHGP